MPKRTVDTALAAAHRGDTVGAAQLLAAGAQEGDGEAALVLGEWRMAGDIIRRDLTLAREYFGRAAELGIDEAEPVYIALLANGAGGSGRRWPEAVDRLKLRARRDGAALAEYDILTAMNLDSEGNPASLPGHTTLHQQPLIRTFEGLLSAAECHFLISLATPLLQPSVVIDPRTGQMVRHPVRTAESVGFPFVEEGPVLHAINRRIAVATATTYEQGEPTQIMSYTLSQEYKLHSDAIPGEPNQRVMTVLICLEDDFHGGETLFPRLNFAWRGRAGDALQFANVDADGRPEPLSWHAGTPVSRGRKIILSKWIRSGPLDLRGPSGRPL